MLNKIELFWKGTDCVPVCVGVILFHWIDYVTPSNQDCHWYLEGVGGILNLDLPL